MPLFTLHEPPRGNPRKTRGQDGSLFLSCKTLAFSTFCRFIPAHRLYPFVELTKDQCSQRRERGQVFSVVSPGPEQRKKQARSRSVVTNVTPCYVPATQGFSGVFSILFTGFTLNRRWSSKWIKSS